MSGIADASYTIGFQPHHLSLTRRAGSGAPIRAKVSTMEITGSESFIHLDFADARWVMLAHGIKSFEPDETVEVFLDPEHLMVFDANGRSVAPTQAKAG
jgi:glycerol transport system ATP-binding protein